MQRRQNIDKKIKDDKENRTKAERNNLNIRIQKQGKINNRRILTKEIGRGDRTQKIMKGCELAEILTTP